MAEKKNTEMLYTEQGITETLKSNYMPYAMSVIVSRAIPEIDGFKPSHRKLLYTMYKQGLLNGGLTKSANVVMSPFCTPTLSQRVIWVSTIRGIWPARRPVIQR